MPRQVENISSKGVRFECDYCHRVEFLTYVPDNHGGTDGSARFMGYRLTSSADDATVICPVCSGAVPERDIPKPSWRVRCETCDWEWADEYDEGPLDARTAKDVARGHQFDPDVSIAPPDGDAWYDEGRVKDDGTITRAGAS